jgi:hypothetical protein
MHYVSKRNIDRSQYHGKRRGDIVECRAKNFKQFEGPAEVIAYGLTDNNKLVVRTNKGRCIEVIAECLEVLVPVEARQN